MNKPADLSSLIRDRWACPSCTSSRLEVLADHVQCGSCQTVYLIDSGIPLFIDKSNHLPTKFKYLCDLSIVILTLNEQRNISMLLRDLKQILNKLKISHELIVVDGGSVDNTAALARAEGASVMVQREPGYGQALKEGFGASQGCYVLTMDADLSHPAEFIEVLWGARNACDLAVASRYVPGAQFHSSFLRKILSQLLNSVFVRILSAPVRDISSGFRLYRHDVLKDIKIDGTNFEALEELLIKIHMNGWRIKEVPFHYAPRKEGKSKARLITFGICLLKTLKSMWALRSSIASADYDERAFDSVIPLQRYWQRTRHKVILEWAKKCQGVILDVGCGSSRIIQDISQIVGVDVALYKLRYMKQKCNSLVLGSIFDLPFADKTFDGIICSQVIEHIPGGDRPFQELARVIRPEGLLIIGTPDYGRPYWPIIERIYKWVHPNGYADEHITHYTLPTLSACLKQVGFEVLNHHYILGAELNVLARKINDEKQS